MTVTAARPAMRASRSRTRFGERDGTATPVTAAFARPEIFQLLCRHVAAGISAKAGYALTAMTTAAGIDQHKLGHEMILRFRKSFIR
ncbi:MAG: hypothetical protein KGJ13_05030 [Patescibacteria group bacterium]|nr:hypothetical protein [Patescibacteria group bacterium]